MKKLLLCMFAAAVILPFVHADLINPFAGINPFGLVVGFLFAIPWVLIANAGINALVILVFQRFFGNSFWEKFGANKIVLTIGIVTVIGLVSDVLGAVIGSLLSLLLLSGPDIYNSTQSATLALLAIGMPFLVTFFCILLGNFFFFRTMGTSKQAFVVALGLAIFTNPFWFTGVYFPVLGMIPGLVLLLILAAAAVFGPFVLLGIIHYLKSKASSEEQVNFKKIERTIGIIIVVLLVIILISIAVSFIGPKSAVSCGGNPSLEAVTMIKDLVNQKGSVKLSQKVGFSNGVSLSVVRLAQASGGQLLPEDVCIGTGDFSDEPENWDIKSSGIAFKGSYNSGCLKFKAMCDSCADMDSSYLIENFDDSFVGRNQDPSLDTSLTPACPPATRLSGETSLFGDKNSTDTCCIIILKKV